MVSTQRCAWQASGDFGNGHDSDCQRLARTEPERMTATQTEARKQRRFVMKEGRSSAEKYDTMTLTELS